MISKTVAAALAVAFASSTALAAAPMAKQQAPGFYRTTLGDFEVTVLNDGTVDLPMDKLLHNKPGQTDKALAKNFLKTPVETSVNAFLINTGSKLVLIDAGAAGLFGPTLGKLVANLKASGYQPEQIDEIYISHMHGDHVGGITAGDKPAFPNAIVRADKRDADFWLSKAEMEKAPEKMKGFFQGAMQSFMPYTNAGKLVTFDGDTELTPGIKANASYGHTPGHTTYVVESKGQKLVLIGDLMHNAAVQFETPSVTIDFDVDSKAAMAHRKAVYADAVKQGFLLGASHLPFPALGHLRGNGKGYSFYPLNYSIPR